MGALLCVNTEGGVTSGQSPSQRTKKDWLSREAAPEDGRLHFIIELPAEMLSALPDRRKPPQSSLFNAMNSGLDGIPSRMHFVERAGKGVGADVVAVGESAIVVKYSVPAAPGDARQVKVLEVLEPSVDGVLGKLSRRQYGTVQRKLSAAVARVRSEAFRDMLLQRLEAVKALREKTGAAA
mgnify:FL=1|tara:strand:+ start:332 stop:874 length:543 start_codon:yes stop_codon:yes gene_type:complete